MRLILALLSLAAFILAGCTATPHSNPLDPNSTVRDASGLSFNITNNIASIEPKAIELTWRRSTEPEFYVYVLSRSESPLNLTNQVISEEDRSNIAAEFRNTDSSNFWWYSDTTYSNEMPTFYKFFKPVAVLPDINLNSYRDGGYPTFGSTAADILVPGKKYYYAYSVILRNGRQFASSPEISVECAPDFSGAKFCDLLFAYADLPTTINAIDVDNNGYMYVGGVSWGIAQKYSTFAQPAWDYFITRTSVDGAFTNSPKYIWEGQSIFLTQFTNYANSTVLNIRSTNNLQNYTNISRFVGFAADDNWSVYLANCYYNSTWRFYMLSNWSGGPSNTHNLFAGLATHVNDKTSRIRLDKTNNVLYIAGARGDGVTEDIFAVDNSTWSTPSGSIVFPQKVHIVGLDFDNARNLYATDSEGNGIWKVPYQGSALNYGTPVFLGGGTGSLYGKYNDIGDIAVDTSSGALFVADTGNNRIQKLDTSGV
ncbi:MAG: hypothetical protein J0L75_19475 [Spirochaetes bacterium]|nr:hypothetical protein [Spirochaetota bacterium]